MTGSTRRLRVGIVGCGRLAERGYLPALTGATAFDLVAVADPDPERTTRVATAVNGVVTCHRDAAGLLAETEVDGLLVASPVGQHVEDATRAAEAGVVALVEKPPAPDAVTAQALCALSPSPLLGFNRRFDPAALAARASIRPGEPVDLTLTLHYRRPSWAAHTVADDALLDLGPHLIDWASWISGLGVRAVAASVLSHERATLDLVLDAGTAHLEAATDRPHQERISVRAADVHLADHRLGGTVPNLLSRVPVLSRPSRLVDTLRGELATYAHALRSGERGDLGSPAEGAAVMAVIDAARASASGGGCAVPVPGGHALAP